MKANYGHFRIEDLKVVDTSRMVVLNSGGPLMEIECIEGDNALCSWQSEQGTERKLFPLVCLSRLVSFTQDDVAYRLP